MIPGYNYEYKTVSSNTWKRQSVIDQQKVEGWNFVREEKVTARKVAIVFWKKVPIPVNSNPEAEVKKYLAEHLTESDSM